MVDRPSPFHAVAEQFARSQKPPAETAAEAAARRRAEFERLTQPSAEAIAEAAAAIILAGQRRRGEVACDPTPAPQPDRRTLTPDEQASTAAAIIAAGKKRRGEA